MTEKKGIPIRFSKQQILSIKPHSNPSIVDMQTGERAMIAKVILPTSEHRDLTFGIDKNGIDRDTRGAFIYIPASHIKLDKTNSEHMRYFYLNPDRQFTINFNGKDTGAIDEHGNTIYDKPEKLIVSANELRSGFYKSYEKDKIKQPEAKSASKKTANKKKTVKKNKEAPER